MQVVPPSTLLSGVFLNPELLGVANCLSVFYLSNHFAVFEIWNRFTFFSNNRFCILSLAQII
jgi:hypothetical protein